MEALSCLFKKVVARGFLSSCQMRDRGGERILVSYFLFIDDMFGFL